MDKELEEAQNLTKDDLLAKLEGGRPAKLARPRRPRDGNQLAKVIVDEATVDAAPRVDAPRFLRRSD